MLARRKKSGFTLIELIVSIAIISIVFGIAYSMLGFGNKIFKNNVDMVNLQDKLRIAIKDINERVRYATEIEIMPAMDMTLVSNPLLIGPYDKYIYFNSATDEIIFLDRFIPTKRVIGSLIDGSTLFASQSPYKSLIVNIGSKLDGKQFQLRNEIYCLNLHLVNPAYDTILNPDLDHETVITVSGPGTREAGGSAIKYKTLGGYISETQKPIASIDNRAGKINNRSGLDIVFNRDLNISGFSEIYDQGTGVSSQFGTVSKTSTTGLRLSFGMNVSDGRTVTINVKFWDDYIYAYICKYSVSDGWEIS